MKSIILTHSMFQDIEVQYPYYRLQEEGTVFIAAETVGKIKGIQGTEVSSNMTAATLNTSDDDYLNVFDLLVLPGGVKAMEKLRHFGYRYGNVEVTSVLAGLRRGIEEIRSVEAGQKKMFDTTLLPQIKLSGSADER